MQVTLPDGHKINVQVTTHQMTVRPVQGQQFVETASAAVLAFCATQSIQHANSPAGPYYSIPKIEDLGWNIQFSFYCLSDRVPAEAKLPAITTIVVHAAG